MACRDKLERVALAIARSGTVRTAANRWEPFEHTVSANGSTEWLNGMAHHDSSRPGTHYGAY